jgi:hypothetical protein
LSLNSFSFTNGSKLEPGGTIMATNTTNTNKGTPFRKTRLFANALEAIGAVGVGAWLYLMATRTGYDAVGLVVPAFLAALGVTTNFALDIALKLRPRS